MDFTDKGMLPQIGNHFDKAKRESKDDLENSKDIENYDRFQNKPQSEQETPEMSKNQEEGGENSRNGEEIKDEAYYAALSKKAIDEELIHLRKDFWFTRILVQKTWIILVWSLVYILFFTFMCAIFGGFELSSHTERDYLIWNEQAVKDYDKYELSKEIVQTNYADGIQPLRTSRMSNWYTSVTFQCSKCDTILTAEYVNEMYQIEQLIVNHNNYVSFCQATSSSDSSCASDAYESFSKQFSGAATQTAIDTMLSSMTTSSYDTNKLFLSTSFTQSNTKSIIARANFNFASPIEIDGKRYKTFIDDEDGQDDKMVDFSEDLNKLINKFNTTLKVQLYNSVFYDSEVDKYVQEDFGLAVASFTFVLIYVSFHLKSVFLGGFAMLAVAFSYPISIFWSRYIFQVDYFQNLNFVAVFVILGISADNLFVFIDTWQQSQQHELLNEDTEHRFNNFQARMNFTWKKATKAVSTTSATTAMAFLATGFSTIMPISAFGYFSSILVVINYTFAVVTFPALLLTWERYISHRCRYRKYIGEFCSKIKSKMFTKSSNRKKVEPVEKVEVRSWGEKSPRRSVQLEAEQRRSIEIKNSPVDQEAGVTQEKEDQKKNELLAEERFIEKFFRVHWNQWIFKTRWIIIICIALFVGFCIWRVTRFEPSKEANQILPDSHRLTKLRDTLRNDYHTGENDDSIKVSIIWGIEKLDQSGISKWDASKKGKLVFDSNFDLSISANQQRIEDICISLESNSLVKSGGVTCWIRDFKTFAGGSYPSGANFYSNLTAYLATTTGQNNYNNYEVGYLNNTLRFIRIQALAVAKPFQGFETMEPIYEEWRDLIKGYDKASPAGVNNSFQTAGYHWAFIPTQKEFVAGAIQGTMISICFAFLVLLISTLNIVIAGFATLAITWIVFSVIAFMEILGWTLGSLESIAIVILIGFSVDYAVHLANHYVESVFDDRFRRMQDALSGIGISIISGAITTIGSGLVLFLATVVFFTKFAFLICGTILFSLLYSFGFFTAMNHAIGPQKNFGNIGYYVVTPLKNKIKQWLKEKWGKKPNDTKNINESSEEKNS